MQGNSKVHRILTLQVQTTTNHKKNTNVCEKGNQMKLDVF